MKHPSPQSDLPLLALRYASGELSTAESADFEQRLAADLDAQIALAQAVQIASTLQTQSSVPSVVARATRRAPVTSSRRWSPWLAVASSCALAVAMLVALRPESAPDALGGASARNTTVGATVAGWAAVDLEDSDLPSVDDAAALLILDEGTSMEEDVAPDWLLSAVEMSDVPSEASDGDASSGDDRDSIEEET